MSRPLVQKPGAISGKALGTTYAEIYRRKAGLPAPPASAPKAGPAKGKPRIEFVPGSEASSATMDLSECDFSGRSVAVRSDFSDSDSKLAQTLRPYATSKSNARCKEKARTSGNRTFIALTPQTRPTTTRTIAAAGPMTRQLRKGSFSRFQFARPCPRGGVCPCLVLKTPQVATRTEKLVEAPARKPLLARAVRRPHAQRLSATKLLMNVGHCQNNVERLISAGPVMRSISPELMNCTSLAQGDGAKLPVNSPIHLNTICRQMLSWGKKGSYAAAAAAKIIAARK